MALFKLSRNICSKVVTHGSNIVIYNVARPRRSTKNKNALIRGVHLFGTTQSLLTDNSDLVEVLIETQNGTEIVRQCTAPLLKVGERLEAGTKVLIQPHQNGQWQIIAAQCSYE